ncbi:FAD/NAD(P)-binding protein [Phaeobacter sp. B1627]|uniref:FAD/NAD(P)-binding protein n=1 Tax=Phaeobacter sp. B1627 TaxID=2583809 RepID=UPI001118A4CD|nr:FAD/NAD(P)-binding domain-containing protein [Phaeobacter sp. B1627]TNJ41286.1 hypothetical protein FGE21_14560 [Phaeobacter sp. B1627]
MDVNENAARIAVVGLGPRGLGALEALGERLLRDGRRMAVDVFDPASFPGAGPNFCPEESPLCLLNIPNRDIAIRPPSFSTCGQFADWLDRTPDPDSFPTRADLGRYLQARLADVRALDRMPVTLHPECVDQIERSEEGWKLNAGDRWFGPYAEVLLTLGQPRTAPDDQLAEWTEHAQRAGLHLSDAYPARRLEEQAKGWQGEIVAIRGLALSSFDVCRALTAAQGGQFQAQGYIASGREPKRIIAFSLDGKPPFAKPETEQIDAWFEPLAAETEVFVSALDRAATSDPDSAAEIINAALVPVVTRILEMSSASDRASDGATDVIDWLQTEWTSPSTQETGSPREILRRGIALAEGKQPPTIGYIVGQVWRKWQDEFRAGFNPVVVAAETAKAIVGFDEGLKRYSYGPPVSSAREMDALIEAGILDLSLAIDPDIELTKTGWKLSSQEEAVDAVEASVMIDAVLPSPDLSTIAAPLVPDLTQSGLLHPLTSGLAAQTAADGRVLDRHGTPVTGLCLLGRLALGSVVAVDSLHDCFGDATNRWAAGVLRRV